MRVQIASLVRRAAFKCVGVLLAAAGGGERGRPGPKDDGSASALRCRRMEYYYCPRLLKFLQYLWVSASFAAVALKGLGVSSCSSLIGQLVGSGGAALQFLRALSDLGMYLMQQVLLSLMPAYSEETADCLEMPLKTLWLKFLPCLYLRVVVLHAALLQHPSPLVQEQPLGSASQNFPSPAAARAAASCVSRRASTNSTGIVCFHHF